MIKTLFQIYRILKWHKRTFPHFTFHQQQLKLNGEIAEWHCAVDECIKHPHKRNQKLRDEELADIVIAATNLYNYPEIHKLVAQKMKINNKRKWQNGQHKN